MDQKVILEFAAGFGDVAAWVGVITGIIGMVLAIQSNRKNNHLQEQIVDIEEQRDQLLKLESMTAILSARAVKAHEAGSQAAMNYLEIKNSSASPASDIRIEIEFFPELASNDHYVMPAIDETSAGQFEFNIPVLGGHSEYYLRLPWVAEENSKNIRRGVKHFFTDIRLVWENVSGEQTNYRHRISSRVPPRGAISAVANWKK